MDSKKIEDNIASNFIDDFYELYERIAETFSVVGNELVNIRCAMLVVKGYTRDYFTQEDKDIEIAFNEEMSNYGDSVQSFKNKIALARSELNKIKEKKANLNTIKHPSEKTQMLIKLYDDTVENLEELVTQLNDTILKKSFEHFKVISVGGINPSINSLNEINKIYADSLANIGSGSKLVKEGMRLKNMIKATLDEIKDKYFTESGKSPTKTEKTEDEEELDTNLDELVNVIKDSVGNVEEEDIDPSLPPIDGDIELKTTREGIFVKIIPPQNGGMNITLPELKSILKGNRVDMPDDEFLKKIIDSKNRDYIKVAKWTPNPKHDATIKIIFKENKTEAYAVVKAPRFSGKDVDKQDFEEALRKNKITYGILEDRIERSLRNPMYKKEILLAEGYTPVKGDNAKFTLHFQTNIKRKPKVDEKGRVDHKQLNIIQNIPPEKLIAEKNPPKPGKPGKNVCGEEIPASFGDDKTIKIKKGAEYRDNGTKIYSTNQGHPILNGNQLEVSPVYIVDGDVSYETGNIIFDGSVIVKGDVADEFSIEAKGDVEINGNVYKSNITAEGNILINQGIKGREEGYIKTGKSLRCTYIENANVTAKDEIIVENNILHSNIKTGSFIECRGKGLIAGGRIICRDYIDCQIIGSQSNVHTIIELGVDDELKAKQNATALEMYKMKEYIDKAQRIMNEIKPKADVDNRIYARYLNIKDAKIRKAKALDQQRKELERIAQKLFEIVKSSYAEANTTYPNVEIRIPKLTKKTQYVIDYPHRIQFVVKEKDICFTQVTRLDDDDEALIVDEDYKTKE
jgi:uncharacterized protein